MKNYIKKAFADPKFFIIKIVIAVLFLVILTGTDLFVKQIVETNLQHKPDVVVIKDFWHFKYVQNDDIGFSLLSYLDGINKFKVLIFLHIFGALIAAGFYYDIKKKSIKKLLMLSIISEICIIAIFFLLTLFSKHYNSSDIKSKWIFLVSLQGSGALIVLIIYLFTDKLKYLIPLAFIISGAFGNLIDRIIRGYVVDFIMWMFKFIPLDLFNPWPIFNLADVYTVIGASLLLIILLFFSKNEIGENKTETESTDTGLNEIGIDGYNYLKDQASGSDVVNTEEEIVIDPDKLTGKKKDNNQDDNSENDIIDVQ